MALSDIVVVNITTSAAQVERAGFGVPLILAADCPGGFTERVRFYTTLAGVLVDFANTTATYKMAAAVFAQTPKLPRLAVGRLALKPTQRWALTPIAGDLVNYQMKVNGNLISVTSDGSGTVTEIIALLKTAIDLLSLGITVSDQTTYMRIVANTAGATFSVESLNVARLGVAQDHADPGIATDLAAIALEDSTWYTILCPFNSKAMADEIADWAESNKKLYVAQTQDSDTIQLSNSSDTGGSQTIAGLLKAEAEFRTGLIYHSDNWAFADAAWVGACLPFDPGSETWAEKTLAGVAVTRLTATQRTNALAKYMNVYESVAGRNVTNNGTVGGNEYIDVIRFRDWLEANIAADVYVVLAQNKKLPFTDSGIAAVQAIILARLNAGVAVGGLSNNPKPVVTVPLAANVSTGDKAARTLTGVGFTATLAGAIQAASISGVVAL